MAVGADGSSPCRRARCTPGGHPPSRPPAGPELARLNVGILRAARGPHGALRGRTPGARPVGPAGRLSLERLPGRRRRRVPAHAPVRGGPPDRPPRESRLPRLGRGDRRGPVRPGCGVGPAVGARRGPRHLFRRLQRSRSQAARAGVEGGAARREKGGSGVYSSVQFLGTFVGGAAAAPSPSISARSPSSPRASRSRSSGSRSPGMGEPAAREHEPPEPNEPQASNP